MILIWLVILCPSTKESFVKGQAQAEIAWLNCKIADNSGITCLLGPEIYSREIPAMNPVQASHPDFMQKKPSELIDQAAVIKFD